MAYEQEEEWRRYGSDPLEVSNLGRVLSITYKGRRRRILKPQPSGRAGYHQVGWYHKGVRRSATVHKLVLGAFVGPRPSPKHHARHANGDKLDNRLVNLCWGTALENSLDQITHGTSLRKLCVGQVREIRWRAKRGESVRKLGKVFGVSSVTIVHITTRQTWAWVVD